MGNDRAGDVIWRKIHPGMAARMTRLRDGQSAITRPKMASSGSQKSTSLQICRGSAVAAQHGVFSASGLVNAVGSRNQHFRDGGNSSRLRLRPDGPGPVIHQITSAITGSDRLTGNTIPPSTNSGETMRHHHVRRHVQRCQPNPSCSSQIARTQGRPLPFHAVLSQTMGLVSVFCTMCRK